MKKNVAGQFINAQMITAADGTVFTGSVTVYVTKDNGAQTIGSVGSGICTHKGNGEHQYAPAQAETNADLIAFTFIGTGAIAATLQVYPSFPQTVDLVTGITGGTITTATNVTTVNGLAANVITAASIATDAIDADALAAGAVTEIWAGSTAPSAATIADAVWDEDATAHQTQGTFGQAIGDPVADANTIYKSVVTDATGATVGVDVVDLKTQIGTAGAGLTGTALATAAALVTAQADLDDIQTRIPAALASGNMKVDVLALNGDTTAAANIAKTTKAIARGTVGAAPSTTSLTTSAFSPSGAAADQFKGRIVTFDADTTTTGLRGQATDITASTNAALPTLTVTLLSATPVSGDTFSVT